MRMRVGVGVGVVELGGTSSAFGCPGIHTFLCRYIYISMDIIT